MDDMVSTMAPLPLGLDDNDLLELGANTTLDGNGTDLTGILVIDDPGDLRKPWKTVPFFYLIITTYLFTLIFGVLGNFFVIILMAGDRKSRNTTNMFLVSLSIADLIMLLIGAPLETMYFFVVLWDSGGTVCKMAKYIMTLSFTASTLNLTAVSLERFIVIVFPMRSRSLCTMSNCRRSVLFVWFVSLILACPVLWVWDTEQTMFTNPSNTEWFTAYYCKEMASVTYLWYKMLVLWLVPALAMIVFYTVVIRELWRSTMNIQVLTNAQRSVPPSTPSESYYLTVSGGRGAGGLAVRNGRMCGGDSAYNSSASLYVPCATTNRSRTPSPGGRNTTKRHREKCEDVKKARKQVIKMLIVVVLLFLLCWGPKIFMQMFIALGMQQFNQAFYNINIMVKLLPFVHCCINPIIYCSMSKNFRRSMKRMAARTWFPCLRPGCCPVQRQPTNNLVNSVGTRSIYSSYSPEGTSRHTDLETVSTI